MSFVVRRKCRLPLDKAAPMTQCPRCGLIFSATGQLQRAHAWGHFMHFFGTLMMLISLAWAATILIRQRRNIGDSSSDEFES